jgi:hypothetical protein
MITDALTLADPFLKFTETVWDPKAFWKVSLQGKGFQAPQTWISLVSGLWILLVSSGPRDLSLRQLPERHRNASACAVL